MDLDPGTILLGVTLCHRYGQRFGRVVLPRRWRTCYPYFLFRDRLHTWQGKYPRSRSV